MIVSTYKVARTPDRGGNYWVYMQYIQGLRRAGCDVYWMDEFRSKHRPGDNGQPADLAEVASAAETFLERARSFGLENRVLLHVTHADRTTREWIGVSAAEAEAVVRGADLFLNFHYRIDPALLSWARRTALMDIDPGLLQHWMTTGDVVMRPHDRYFSTGETVGTPRALFPDCGLRWIYSPPPVCLDLWPVAPDTGSETFTTVAGWWAGGAVWVVENGAQVLQENTKRAAFLPFIDLPRQTKQPLELALDLTDADADARQQFEAHGWRIRSAQEVTSTPASYQKYIQGSRGEWSAAKASCMRLQNAWVSDRSLCYLASGKPAVVQDTGPSKILPCCDGLVRFNTVAEAAAALETVTKDYAHHARAARQLVELHFDASRVVPRLLDAALA